MGNVFLFYAVSMTLLSVLYHLDFSGKKDTLSMRKKQTEDLFKENVIREKIDKALKERVKLSKRNSVEDKLKQAGFNIEFTEFMIISLFSGVVFAIIFGSAMTNFSLAIMFLIFGTFAPYQVVSFIKNRRIKILEKQIGSFMQMTIKRYENTANMHSALKLTAREFQGTQPISAEINKTVLEIELGVTTDEALKNMAMRTGNSYMERFSSYYEVAAKAGTEDLRKNLLIQAYNQYEENRQLKRELDEKISGPVKDAYIMLASIPMFAVYQLVTNKDYATFMTKTTTGRIGTTAIVGTIILILWFVNAKLAAPLDKNKK